MVGLRGDRLGGVGGAAVGEPEDDVEHLDRVDDAEHQHDVHHRPQQRPRHVPEGAPAGGAVQGRRLVKLPGTSCRPP